MRTKRTLLNMAYALGSSLLLLLLGLVTRRLLVDNFGPQITTASQVVSQLFNFFSIAEFGVGSVISYRLYEQIAAKNEEKISKYMSMYKWAYRVVGLVIAGLALIGAAALRWIMPDVPAATAYTVYGLNVVSTLCSYFLITRRLMYTCTQQGYRCTQIDFCCNVLTSLAKIAVSLWFPNYVLYFSVTIFFNVTANLLIARRFRKDFPYVHDVRVTVNDFKDLGIFHDLRYFLVHRLSNTIYGSSDTIVTSRLGGSTQTTFLGNYNTISTSATDLGNKVMDSFAAAIGSIVYDKSAATNDHDKQVFWGMDLFSYLFASFVATAYFCLFQPFMASWMGEKWLLPLGFVLVFCLNEYVGWNHRMLGSYRAVLGHFEDDQWFMVASATVNLALSFILFPLFDITGALIATVCGLLGEALDAYAPGLAARLRGEVERRVLTPYRTAHFWWMGNGDEPMCNWTPWCTQNVLLAAAQCAPAEDLPAYVQQAAYSIDCFLKDYGDDGCCSEGAQYYRHAALTMFNALDLLCKMAPGVFDDVWAEPKIRNMAEYIVNMHIAGPYYLNFADCSPLAGARGVREYLFGKRVGSLPLMTLAARDWAAVLAADPDPDRLHHPDDSEGINLFYHIQAAMAEREVTAFAETAAPAAPHDVWYPSVGILVSRRGAYALGDSHNHNDVGSVTLYRDGRPLLIDVGVETYSKKTFSPQRYEIWTMQSGWHNLPQFDPDGAKYDQQPGAAFAAADVTVTDALDGLAMDLAPAYGSVPGLGRYRRSVHLTDTGLTLHDETDYPGTVALTLMSVEKPTVDGDTVAFGALAAAAVTGADKIVTEAVPIADPRLRQAWPGTLYRTRIYFTQQLSLVIE